MKRKQKIVIALLLITSIVSLALAESQIGRAHV